MRSDKYAVKREMVRKLPSHVRTFVDVNPDGTLVFYLNSEDARSVPATKVSDVAQAKDLLGSKALDVHSHNHDEVVDLALDTLKKEPIFIADMSHFCYRGA